MHIIGTAGHVDHGKSTLIAALTGTHPDRLKEEIAREMTIDLGFADLTLPNGEQIGIIDVPGHRDFIGNMLSGIGGIDAVLLVIAADEGVSPQTREHLAILDLLEIRRGIVVLTKIDLAPDPAWLDLVEMEARELVAPTTLADAPVVRVSARTGSGLAELQVALERILADIPPKRDLGRPRLPADRVFSLSGFGTVVTGTLLDGSFSVGDEVICLPEEKHGRVRGLQNHKHKLQSINPGYRTAINISGVDKSEIARGTVVAHPGDYQPTTLLDARLRLLPDAPLPLKHFHEVKLYSGAAEVSARVRLLGREALPPGETAFIQLRCEQPVVVERGDHFILRLPSPAATLGGGIILDPHPSRAYRRQDVTIIARLQQLLDGSASDLLGQALELLGISTRAQLQTRVSLPEATFSAHLDQLIADGEIIVLQGDSASIKKVLIHKRLWEKLTNEVLEKLAEFHQQQPLKPGLKRDVLRSWLGLPQTHFDLLVSRLAAEGSIRLEAAYVALSTHHVRLTDQQQALATPILEQFAAQLFAPPTASEIEGALGADILEGLVGSGQLKQVSDQILFTPAAFDQMRDWVLETITNQGSLTLAQLRDHFGTSRKYAAAFLEYLDQQGITLRKGDIRTLRRVK